MIDNRVNKINNHEIDEALKEITDTEVLLNFQRAIVSLYPHLIPIHAFAYDPWDDIIEPLFYEMVYNTFTYKYGIEIKHKEAHTYNLTLGCYKGINHIECIPKYLSIKALVDCEWIDINSVDLEDKVLIFKSFGDGKHFLTGGLDVEEAFKVGFNLVEVDIVSPLTGHTLNESVFINKDDLDFEFVAETYDKDIQGA
ncbi:hypothetical protein IM538_03840 [Cytobacillus suaedae]|nr:hypothetical protein IM538_03840 [Cytobacillus suaedae]